MFFLVGTSYFIIFCVCVCVVLYGWWRWWKRRGVWGFHDECWLSWDRAAGGIRLLGNTGILPFIYNRWIYLRLRHAEWYLLIRETGGFASLSSPIDINGWFVCLWDLELCRLRVLETGFCTLLLTLRTVKAHERWGYYSSVCHTSLGSDWYDTGWWCASCNTTVL